MRIQSAGRRRFIFGPGLEAAGRQALLGEPKNLTIIHQAFDRPLAPSTKDEHGAVLRIDVRAPPRFPPFPGTGSNLGGAASFSSTNPVGWAGNGEPGATLSFTSRWTRSKLISRDRATRLTPWVLAKAQADGQSETGKCGRPRWRWRQDFNCPRSWSSSVAEKVGSLIPATHPARSN